jgi:hypothetical protein
MNQAHTGVTERIYLVRYGKMQSVGRFRADSGPYMRGQQVVLSTDRGTELGRVLLDSTMAGGETPAATILRGATNEDLDLEGRRSSEASVLLGVCCGIVEELSLPLVLLDVEPLLDARRFILDFLGPVAAAQRLQGLLLERDGLQLDLEPMGAAPDLPLPAGCGGCQCSAMAAGSMAASGCGGCPASGGSCSGR